MGSFEHDASGILTGLKVLSFGTFVAGNTCAMALAELGAEVVKIESRLRPEALRSYSTPDHPPIFEPSGIQTTALQAGLSRSTRGLCLEMSTEPGRQLFRALVGRCAVVMENFGKGQMERWGCSFADLVVHNPRLVMLSISGYGRTGPRSTYRAYGVTINNFLGLAAAWDPRDGTHFDHVAGIHGASAVLAALRQVKRSGQGVYLDLAQAESGAAVMAPLYLDDLANHRPWTAQPNEVPGALLSFVFRCAGADAWACIEIQDEEDWSAVCTLLERDDLRIAIGDIGDDATKQISQALEKWAAPLHPLQAALELQRVGVAAAPVQDTEDVWRDPQLRNRGATVEVVHPDIGPVEYPQSPDRMSVTTGRVQSRAPRLGEHSAEILARWLDLEDNEIQELADQGAIWYPPDS